MFNSKEIKELRIQLEQEKRDLELFQNSLKEKTDKINVSNLFVLNYKGKYLIVEKINTKYIKEDTDNKSCLVDIFTQKKFYSKNKIHQIQYIEVLEHDSNNSEYACIFPILDIEPSLISFPNNKTSLYSLLKLYYQLNKTALYNENHNKNNRFV